MVPREKYKKPDNSEIRKRLVALGVERLAHALVCLAAENDDATAAIDRMVSLPEEMARRCLEKVRVLKRKRGFVDWRGTASFRKKVEDVLKDIEEGIDDPRIGVELMAAFVETDDKVLGNCDDSGGSIGDLYRFRAVRLFSGYAQGCADKEWLSQLILSLNREDNYGIRHLLVDSAKEYLPEKNIRKLINSFQELACKQGDERERGGFLMCVESLARQVKDAPLFEKTRIAAWGKTPVAACLDIAEVYFESGDSDKALHWMEKIPHGERFKAQERDDLLARIYKNIGDFGKLHEVALRNFRRHRSKKALVRLLEVIGSEKRDEVVAGEVDLIMMGIHFSLCDAVFLLDTGRPDQTEKYLLNRVEQVEASDYKSFQRFAIKLEENKLLLGAVVVYRVLLGSILDRRLNSAYSSGARYLRRMETLSRSIDDWRGLDNHQSYFKMLKEKHGRKSSFWSHFG